MVNRKTIFRSYGAGPETGKSFYKHFVPTGLRRYARARRSAVNRKVTTGAQASSLAAFLQPNATGTVALQ